MRTPGRMDRLAAGGLCLMLVCAIGSRTTPAAEQQIVLREHLNLAWTNEWLTYPFSVPENTCHADSVTLTGLKDRPVPAQLSDIAYWPGSTWVKSATLSFVADLAPLTADTYTVRYGDGPDGGERPVTDLRVTPGPEQVEVATKQFGARLLLGEQTYEQPVASSEVPGPVVAMRLGVRPDAPQADGTWFGGSAMYGPGKLKAYSARLTDIGPVFARVVIRYTYENGNAMDVALQVVAGDNTIRCETRVKQDQPDDGFNLVLSRGLPPLVFHVQEEAFNDREQFPKRTGSVGATFKWREIPLADYVGPKDRPWLITQVSPWEDWFNSFTQTKVRIQLQDTTRELQIRSQDVGDWVDPVPFEECAKPNPGYQRTPAQTLSHKLLALVRGDAGDIFLQVDAAMGERKWTVSDCVSVEGIGSTARPGSPQYTTPETLPAGTRPTIGSRLNVVKDYVLSWSGGEGKHPRLFMSRADLEAIWKRKDTDPALVAELMKQAGPITEDRCPYGGGFWDSAMALGAYVLSGSSEVMSENLLVRARRALTMELKGVMFGGMASVPPTLYDAVVDAPELPEAERPILRAQMAYYGYRLADPATWSIERGYASGNPNMTATWVMPQGMVACTIPEHPMAKTWYRKAQTLMEGYLSDYWLGPAGEFREETGGHGLTTVGQILSFAIMSTRAGMHDYLSDPRVKRLLLYLAKLHTPRDPRVLGDPKTVKPDRRLMPVFGRDPIMTGWAGIAVMARATHQSDPAYSAVMQWIYQQSGAEYDAAWNALRGFQYGYIDPTLPAQAPAWTSEVLPWTAAILRHGLDTPNEHYLSLYSGHPAFIGSQYGSLPAIYAYGTPVAGAFSGGYDFQEGLLTCHVGLARRLGTVEERRARTGLAEGTWHHKWANFPNGPAARFGERGGWANISAFSALPRQDYAAADVSLHVPQSVGWIGNIKDLPEWPPVPKSGQPPVDWRRQILFLKDDDPGHAAYYLLRDSVRGVNGPQPTMWQMWTLSEKIGAPDQVQDLTAFLADKPGHAASPARELQGARFTAVGQLGVDVEYYIASPTGTPRHTLRWGDTDGYTYTKGKYPEYQDLLHLQMPGDGAYFVAFYPRKQDWPAPTFSTLGEGLIIKVESDFGTDYGFLSAVETTVAGEDASFRGTAASVQDRPDGLVLSLGAKGEVRYKDYRLVADFAASLRITDRALTVELPEKVIDGDKTLEPMVPFPGGTLTVTAPGNWTLAKAPRTVRLAKSATGFALAVPAELKAVTLIAQN